MRKKARGRERGKKKKKERGKQKKEEKASHNFLIGVYHGYIALMKTSRG